MAFRLAALSVHSETAMTSPPKIQAVWAHAPTHHGHVAAGGQPRQQKSHSLSLMGWHGTAAHHRRTGSNAHQLAAAVDDGEQAAACKRGWSKGRHHLVAEAAWPLRSRRRSGHPLPHRRLCCILPLSAAPSTPSTPSTIITAELGTRSDWRSSTELEEWGRKEAARCDSGDPDLEFCGLPSIVAAAPPVERGAVDEAWSRGRWLLGLLVLQSMSSVVLDRYQELLQDHLVVTLFLTMLVRCRLWVCVGGGGRGAAATWKSGLPPACTSAGPGVRGLQGCRRHAEARPAPCTRPQVGAGGNAGNQSAIKVIRGLATGTMQDTGAGVRRAMQQQVAVGLMLGTGLAAGGWVRVYLTNGDVLNATAISIALFLIVLCSVVAGTGALVPRAVRHGSTGRGASLRRIARPTLGSC